MLNEYKLSTPFPTDYFSQIFANIRYIKARFAERYILDHHFNNTDTTISDGHDKVTMFAITKNTLADKEPYPLNPATGIAQLPANCGMLWIKNVSGSAKLCYSGNNLSNTLKEITLR